MRLVRSTRSMLSSGAMVLALAAQPSSAAAQSARITPDRLTELAGKPTPRLADGRPDLSGTWDHLGGIEFVRPQRQADGSGCVLGCAPAPTAAPAGPTAPAPRAAAPSATASGTAFPRYKPEFLARVADLEARQVKADGVLRCLAPGVPRIGPPQKIVMNAREVAFFYDDVSGGFFRIIPIDGRPHRTGLSPSYLGDAVGRFDGDTLVVETVNFNEDTWLTDNGAFHTKGLRVVEHLRRSGDTIAYQATAHDPAVLAEPWIGRAQTLWITDLELEESARCEDRDLEHVVDGSHHTNPR